MPAVVPDRTWTVERVHALPDDGNRYECVDGELLVSPAPRVSHQRAVAAFTIALHQAVTRSAVEVLPGPVDFIVDPRTLMIPDVVVVRRGVRDGERLPVPVVVIEILSPGTTRHDRLVKRPRYQRADVADLWIVDLDARLIERWTPEEERPEIVTDRLEWAPPGGGTPLSLDLPSWFASVLPDDA